MKQLMHRATMFLGLLLAALVAAPAAHAGQVSIHACTVDGVLWDNRSWAPQSKPPQGIAVDDTCPQANQNMDLHADPGARTPEGSEADFTFRAPAGTTIADFRLERRVLFRDPVPEGTHRHYALFVLGQTIFAGAGDYEEGTRRRLADQNSWYGYGTGRTDTGRGVVTRASFPALAGYKGDATSLSLRLGCFKRGSVCGVGQGGFVVNGLFGAVVTLEDPTAPNPPVVEASGLLAGGARNGADPVRIVRATDGTGIRRAEIVDVTDPSAPRIVGAEDYDTTSSGTRTDAGASCAYRVAHACPDLSGETLRATSLPAGRRRLVVRVTDPAGNASESGDYTVDVAVPSDRGAPNGAAAGETGGLTVTFPRGQSRRTEDFGARTTLSGRLVNEGGQGVSGAELRVLTRDADRDEFVDGGAVTTDAAGGFSYRATAYANRLIQFAWRARANDQRFALNAYASLRVRAGASLRASRRSVGLRRSVRLSGTLMGRRSAGVDVVLEGKGSGERRYRTFDETRTRSGGRFSASVRFLRSASRGKTFRIRAKILPTGRHPYLRGLSRTVQVRVR